MSKIFAPNPETGHYEWMEKEEYLLTKIPSNSSAAVWDDYDYQGVGFPGNPRVTSRSQHRELLKRHSCVEVGSERPNIGGR